MHLSPSITRLRNGAYLQTIAHAIWLAKNDTLHHEVSWDGDVFLVNNSMGAKGTISFTRPVVGAFYDAKSSRNPYTTKSNYDSQVFFRGAPPTVTEKAYNVVFKYNLDIYNSKTIPIITSAFWSQEENLYSNDDWVSIVEHGGHLIAPYIGNEMKAIQHIIKYYNFSSEIAFILSLYNRRVKQDGEIVVASDDLNHLLRQADNGRKVSEALFNNIGISFH